jgi:mannitol operon transcriptional antiterminator
MATAQLLVARMRAYFPRLGSYRVVSLRELGNAVIPGAHLIITTIPLPAKINEQTPVIQVHPLLLPQDVAKITQWLAS